MRNTEFPLPPYLMDQLAERIEAQMGLSFAGAKRRDLQNAVHRMAESKGFEHEEACVDWLLSGDWDKEKTDLCALHLTIGETYFFREPRAFELLCDYARRKLREPDANRCLRIWSAGCCTGEEPYSIAMALAQMPEADRSRISILATDVNNNNLRIARAGMYRQWSFRRTGAELQSRFFSEYDNTRFRINDEIRDAVNFAELNLATASYPSVANDTHAMDIIFCRNVLMYFSREQAKKVIERFRQCLVEGGWLVVSPSEATSELFAGFEGHYYPDAIYFQKKSAAAAVSSAVPVMEHSPVAAKQTTNQTTKQADFQALVPAPAKAKPAKPKPSHSRARRTAPAHTGRTEHSRLAACQDDDTVIAARALANQGRVAEALHCLDQAIEADPASAELHHAKALIAMEAGDRHVAMQSLKRVIYIEPDFILAHYLMGVLQASLNRTDEAARQFEAADDLLAALADEDIVPGSDGLHAAYLRESMRAWMQRED